jgi:hypothetical protein
MVNTSIGRPDKQVATVVSLLCRPALFALTGRASLAFGSLAEAGRLTTAGERRHRQPVPSSLMSATAQSLGETPFHAQVTSGLGQGQSANAHGHERFVIEVAKLRAFAHPFDFLSPRRPWTSVSLHTAFPR